MRKILMRVLIGVAAVVILALSPVIWTEAQCYSSPEAEQAPIQSLLDVSDRRAEVNTYLTYPEWSIVHAYEDFAGVTRQGSESDFAYFRSIRSYWSSLCSITQMASSRGVVPSDTKVMLYVIGVSFAAEMGIKGLWEETIGAVTALIRGPRRTPEDEFALTVADDYATFLRQTPWYEYPFAQKLKAFWSETPLWGGNVIRKLERRIALTLEYGVKAIYAKLIGLLAGLDPAPLAIRSVVTSSDLGAIALDPNIKVIKQLSSQSALIETPRYRVFTEIIRKLAASGVSFAEIAGNDDVLVTILAKKEAKLDLPGARQLFRVQLQSRNGWYRTGLDVKVSELTELIRSTHGADIQLEHVYDY